MNAPTPESVREALDGFGPREQKILIGLFTVMVREPARVREREWIVEQLAELVLVTGEFEDTTPEEGLVVVRDFLTAHSDDLLNAAFLLFQRVGEDLAPRAAEGFGLEDAVQRALEYFPAASREDYESDSSRED